MLRWLSLALVALCLSVPVVLVIEAGQWWQASGPLTQSRTIVLGKGGTQDIARELAEGGIIDRPLWFVVAAKLNHTGRGFKAGEYLFPAAISPAMVATMLDRGDVVIHHLVIPEGLTTVEALNVVAAAPALVGLVSTPPGEGRLLPNTYFYLYGDHRQALVDRMVRGMSKTLAELWAARAPGLPLVDSRQAVILASIVEKETALASERPLIAQVFYNRLRKGMRLQSDPTVIYALTRGQTALGRPLDHDDLATESPYNTYVISGLPAGPIANPGRASLAAVLHPAPTDALYFVANGQGGHRFATSLRQHDQDINHWHDLTRRRVP